jgi:DNA-binding transcriptional ArsR family regulator
LTGHPGSAAVHRGTEGEATPSLLDDESAVALAETFRILGDTTRVRILDVISRSERCVSDIARAVGMSDSAVSHQLRLLRGQRLVRPRRSGRQVFYLLDDHHIAGLFAQGLEHVQESARSSQLRRSAGVEQS